MLQQPTSVFPRRFFFNALLPTLVFGTVLAAVILGSVAGLPEVFAWRQGLDLFTQIVVAPGYVAAIWFLAAAVASH